MDFSDRVTWMIRLPRALANALIDRANGGDSEKFIIECLVRGIPGKPVDPAIWRIPGYETLNGNAIDAIGWAESAFAPVSMITWEQNILGPMPNSFRGAKTDWR